MDPYLQKLKELHEYYKTGEFSKLGISIVLGVNRRTLRRWFQGKHPPTKKHLKLIRNFVEKLEKDRQSESL